MLKDACKGRLVPPPPLYPIPDSGHHSISPCHQLLTSLAAAAVLGRAVEGQLGGRETLVTLGSALVGASLCAWAWVTATFAVAVSTSSTAAAQAGDALYDPILGFHGATAALLVALKQVVPENEVTLFSHFSFRFKVRLSHSATCRAGVVRSGGGCAWDGGCDTSGRANKPWEALALLEVEGTEAKGQAPTSPTSHRKQAMPCLLGRQAEATSWACHPGPTRHPPRSICRACSCWWPRCSAR